ncbi:MAG: helix-turn-helix domain-containing protein [Pseudohongiellaceae bacterium]
MQLIHDSFIFLALSQLVTTSVYFLIHHRNRSGLLFLGLFLCLACYVAWPHSAFDEGLDTVLYRISLLTPVLLYAIARYLFLDEARMKPLDWLLLAYFLVFREIVGGVFFSPAEASDAMLIYAYILPLAILIYFAVMAAVYITQGYRSDLLENRRTLRLYFVISTWLFIIPRLVSGLLVYSNMLVFNGEFSNVNFPELIHAVFAFLIFLGFNLLCTRRHEDLRQLFMQTSGAGVATEKAAPVVARTAIDDAEAQLVERIETAMTREALFTQQGFAISDLAQALSVSETRLRKTINHEMGFRNFNQFLNHYRLTEASRRLKESDAPVSTIAFEAGYTSLSSFNSVFKNQFARTPTEYRQSMQGNGDSASKP